MLWLRWQSLWRAHRVKAKLEMGKQVMKVEISALGASTLQKSRRRGHEGISPTISARQNPALWICRLALSTAHPG